MHKVNSIYENMYNIDQDYEMHDLIEKIHHQSKLLYIKDTDNLINKDFNLLTEVNKIKVKLRPDYIPGAEKIFLRSIDEKS